MVSYTMFQEYDLLLSSDEVFVDGTRVFIGILSKRVFKRGYKNLEGSNPGSDKVIMIKIN